MMVKERSNDGRRERVMVKERGDDGKKEQQ